MNTRHIITTTVGVVCALAGASAGVAEGSASTHHLTRATKTAVGWENRFGPSIGRDLAFGGFGAIHAVIVEPNAKHGFDTLTVDAGKITAADVNSVTLVEGSHGATYATPTITPAGTVTVTLDAKTSTLSALHAGDHVIIAQSSAGTSRVSALDGSATAGGRGTGTHGTSSGWGPGGSGSGWGPGGSSSGWAGGGPGGSGGW